MIWQQEHAMRTENEKLRAEVERLRRSLSRVYAHGFVAGRDYEALDALEAMRTLGDFEERERVFLASVIADEVRR